MLRTGNLTRIAFGDSSTMRATEQSVCYDGTRIGKVDCA
jgi:hypothetical protein